MGRRVSSETDGPREVITHVVASITAASSACAGAVAARLHKAAASADPSDQGSLERLGITLAGAQHTAHPTGERLAMVVVAGDHIVALVGVDLGNQHPTVVAVQSILDGTAALATVCQSLRAPLVVVDAGTEARRHMPGTVVQVGRGPAGDATVGAAMTPLEVVRAIEAGIAVAVSIADQGVDVIGIGRVGLGSEIASAAVVAILTDAPLRTVTNRADAELVAAAVGAADPKPGPYEVLAAVGGGDTAVLAGVILGAASMRIPVVLDDHGTSAAALVAVRVNPDVAGYLIAAHAGSLPAHKVALAAIGISPMFPVGLAQGEGTGAALVLGMARAAGRLLAT